MVNEYIQKHFLNPLINDFPHPSLLYCLGLVSPSFGWYL